MADNSEHWSRLGESGAVFGMKLLLLVYRLFGRNGFRVCLYPVMVYYYLFRGSARRASQAYLRRIRPLLAADQCRGLSSFRHFISFGEILLDKLLVWMGRIRREDVVFANPDIAREIDVNPAGGIIVVSHLGNFEICNALSQQLAHLRLTVLVYTRHAQKFNSLLRGVSADADVEILQVNDLSPATLMLFADRVNAGGYVVIAGDRTPLSAAGRVSEVEFLGGIAAFPQGPFIIAGLLKCPVFFLFCIKQEARYHVYLERYGEPIDFHQRERRPEILDAAVQVFANRLQYYCLQAPLQWFNFFPFWREERAHRCGEQQ
jgi:predicted LPLAT superfamily acyltransferase